MRAAKLLFVALFAIMMTERIVVGNRAASDRASRDRRWGWGPSAKWTMLRAESVWTPLWNGKDLEGWTTWMQRPSPTSEVPGLKRDADGKYTEPIGSGIDPLKVFTIVSNVDGRPAIRISGEVFGELRSKGAFKDYHLRLQFKWGEKKWPPR